MDARYQTLAEAINEGNLQVLHQLIQENPFILTDVSFIPPPEPLTCCYTCRQTQLCARTRENTMTTPENTTMTTMIPNGITRSVTTTTTSGNTTTTTTSRNVTKTSVPSGLRSSASRFLFVNTVAPTASITIIEHVSRRLAFRRELLGSSFCVSFIYGLLVAELAKKESVSPYLMALAFFMPASMGLFPGWVFKVRKWLRQRREERRWTQNNAG